MKGRTPMRAMKGAARTKAKRRIFKRAEGFVGGRRKLLRTAMETLDRAGAFAFRDRRARKRDFRRLWITRLSAACRERELRYSQLIAGLKSANIELDRKSLSELAIADPAAFDAVIDKVKAALKA
jgi:large subunit ribosomal protein L20